MNSKSGAEDWSLSGRGEARSIGWLCVQFALNTTLLLITTSGLVADLAHLAEGAITRRMSWFNPSLKVLEEGEESLEESGGLARGPSRPVLFSQVRLPRSNTKYELAAFSLPVKRANLHLMMAYS